MELASPTPGVAVHCVLLALSLSVLGVEVGWEPLPDGGMTYVIQIEPELLESLADGRIPQVESVFHPDAGRVAAYRTVRVVMGRGRVDRTAPSAPGMLPPGLDGRPMAERPATFFESPAAAGIAGEAAPASPAPDETASGQPDEPRRPWGALLATLMGLFASLGGNAYLGWITWETRRRYRQAVAQADPTGPAPPPTRSTEAGD
jgi:hypothetical protein